MKSFPTAFNSQLLHVNPRLISGTNATFVEGNLLQNWQNWLVKESLTWPINSSVIFISYFLSPPKKKCINIVFFTQLIYYKTWSSIYFLILPSYFEQKERNAFIYKVNKQTGIIQASLLICNNSSSAFSYSLTLSIF